MIVEPLALRDIEPARRAGVALAEISGSKRDWDRSNRRPTALTARDALLALAFESTLVAVAASNLKAGIELSDEDHERLWAAHNRIVAINDEFTR